MITINIPALILAAWIWHSIFGDDEKDYSDL